MSGNILKIKDDKELKKLEKFGFRPKYNEDTGKVKRYIFEEIKKSDKYLRIEIEFLEVTIKEYTGGIYQDTTILKGWFITYIESDFLYVIYNLIQAGLVEKVERS